MATFKNTVTGRDVHAIFGDSPDGRGVVGWSTTAYGVSGDSKTSAGIRGTSLHGPGTEGWSTHGEGVVGITDSGGRAAIAAFNRNSDGTGAALFAQKAGSVGHAGYFDGNVHVTGDLSLTNADCAEQFDIADAYMVEPGTVMVVGDSGILQTSGKSYDKRVAGVVSGAGNYKPGLILDQHSSPDRKPIALLGKVYCKVDAAYGPIAVGDLLTTSDTPGHAMSTADPVKAFGAVIGKALRSLETGQGLIPILVALQ